MDAQLLSDLKSLLEKYPVLDNTNISFDTDGAITIEPIVEMKEFKKCSVAKELPTVIKGVCSKIEVRQSKVHGYGIFAKEFIAEGEVIEECKLLRLGWRSNYIHDPVLKDYVWANKMCECIECKTYGHVNYIALGNGSLYNHSDNPNTIQKVDFKSETMTITSAKQIEAGQEIYIRYGEKYWIVREFWQQVNANKQLEKFHEENIKPFINRSPG